MTANQAFTQAFKGEPNFMTPKIIKRGTTKRFHWELSQGRGFNGDAIWGITVLNLDASRSPNDDGLSNMYHSKQDALDAIMELA